MIQQIAIALGLGLLVGLQREWDKPHVAGIRTFALVTVFGTVCAQLAASFGGWILAAGLISTAAMIVVSAFIKYRAGEIKPGTTTEVAAVVMFAVGAMLVHNAVLALIIGGTVAVLLHWKGALHAFVRRIGTTDLKTIIQLALIALVILPALPNRPYGPYDVLNPFHIWLMVVLIVGISALGYTAYKFLGAKTGIVLGGIFGGLISSTATTITYSRRSSHSPEAGSFSALVIMIASTVLFARVAVEVAMVAPSVLPHILPQLTALLGLMSLLSAGYAYLSRTRKKVIPVDEPPAELKAAILFGLLYGVIRFVTAAAQDFFGDQGLYVVAVLSGLTDVDAITLSTANFIAAGELSSDIGWRMIVTGALSNLVFKAAAAVLLGRRNLAAPIGTVFSGSLLGGLLILFFWPATP